MRWAGALLFTLFIVLLLPSPVASEVVDVGYQFSPTPPLVPLSSYSMTCLARIEPELQGGDRLTFDIDCNGDGIFEVGDSAEYRITGDCDPGPFGECRPDSWSLPEQNRFGEYYHIFSCPNAVPAYETDWIDPGPGCRVRLQPFSGRYSERSVEGVAPQIRESDLTATWTTNAATINSWEEGDSVFLSYRFSNIGDYTTNYNGHPDCGGRAYIDIDENPAGGSPLLDACHISAGASKTGVVSLGTLVAGDYSVDICADHADVLPERSELNNCDTIAFTIEAGVTTVCDASTSDNTFDACDGTWSEISGYYCSSGRPPTLIIPGSCCLNGRSWNGVFCAETPDCGVPSDNGFCNYPVTDSRYFLDPDCIDAPANQVPTGSSCCAMGDIDNDGEIDTRGESYNEVNPFGSQISGMNFCGTNFMCGGSERDGVCPDDYTWRSCGTRDPDCCGNGNVDGGETCDDGNINNNDGCSSTCQNEAFCGDGSVDAGEQCDDGNAINTDACVFSNGCQNARCGDGYVRTGWEQCDDGNTIDTDACVCDGTVGRNARCGDGFVRSGVEQCDLGDGVNSNTGACTLSCQNNVCGDGNLWAGVEVCDDGNTNNGDGCDSSCEIEPDCGDGILGPGETCDDGNTNSNDGCSSSCQVERCGDGIQQTGEACDDGNTASEDGCRADCLATETCGDGVRQIGLGEQCDDENANNNDACKNDCSTNVCGDGITYTGVEECDLGVSNSNTGSCTLSCQNAECGDGFVQAGEACDDGNTNSSDGCNSSCQVEFCGDGILQPGLGETCDDGNANNNDACKNNCEPNVCGDGVIHTGVEECETGACCTVSCTFRAENSICGSPTNLRCGGAGSPASCSTLYDVRTCSGSSAACDGLMITQSQNTDAGNVCDPGNPQLGGTAPTSTTYCGEGTADACLGQQPRGPLMTCNGAGACNQDSGIDFNTEPACTGEENDMCIVGTGCTNMCWVGGDVDNNGNSVLDSEEGAAICRPACSVANCGTQFHYCSISEPDIQVEGPQSYTLNNGLACAGADESCYCANCPAGTTLNTTTGFCHESNCEDGLDNDLDGNQDFTDVDCNGQNEAPIINLDISPPNPNLGDTLIVSLEVINSEPEPLEYMVSILPTTPAVTGGMVTGFIPLTASGFEYGPHSGTGSVSDSLDVQLQALGEFEIGGYVQDLRDTYPIPPVSFSVSCIQGTESGAPASDSSQCCSNSCYYDGACYGNTTSSNPTCLPNGQVCDGTYNDPVLNIRDMDESLLYTTGANCPAGQWMTGWCEGAAGNTTDNARCDTTATPDSTFFCGDDPDEYYDTYTRRNGGTPQVFEACLSRPTGCFGQRFDGSTYYNRHYTGTNTCTGDYMDDTDCDGDIAFYDTQCDVPTLELQSWFEDSSGVTTEAFFSDYEVDVQYPWGGYIDEFRAGETDSDGRATLNDIPPGEHRVRVTVDNEGTKTNSFDTAINSSPLTVTVQYYDCTEFCTNQNDNNRCDNFCYGRNGCPDINDPLIDLNERRVMNASHPDRASRGRLQGEQIVLDRNETHVEYGLACRTYLGWEEAPEAQIQGEMESLIKYTRLVTINNLPVRMVIATWDE